MSKIVLYILAMAAGLGLSVPVRAADVMPYAFSDQTSLASDWVSGTYASTRLVSAQTAVGPEDTQVLLGFQIDLKPGWKTYWRSPGEAGVPPRWQWDKAGNVFDVIVEWPLPKRSSLYGIHSLVYEHQVVIPMMLKLTNPGKAVSLDLKVDYFVCENICVPLEGRYRLNIPATAIASRPTEEASLIADYVKRVPPQVGQEQLSTPGGVKIRGLRLANAGGNPAIEFDAVGDGPMNKADVFVEGPKDLGFGLPRRSAGKSDTSTHFSVPVYGDGLNVAEALAKAPLVLTLTDGDGDAAEYRLKVK